MKIRGQKIDKDILLDWYFENKERTWVKVGAHGVFWVFILFLGWFIHFGNFPNVGKAEWVFHSLTIVLNCIVFYLIYVQFKNKRWVLLFFVFVTLPPLYILSTKYFFMVSDTLDPESQYVSEWKLLFEGFKNKELLTKPESFIVAFFFNARIIFIPLIIKKALSIIEQNELNKRKKEDNINLELSFLRSQVNPHFLFNSLNNIYGQSLENQSATNLIIAISNLLRYSLSKPENNWIKLQDEINAIKQYSLLLDSFFDREGSVEVRGELKGDPYIRPFTIIRYLDCMFDFNKFESKVSRRIIQYNESNTTLDFDIFLKDNSEKDELIKVLTNVRKCLKEFSGNERANLTNEKVEDQLKISFSTTIAHRQ